MTDDARDRLLALSAKLADGEAIDWERARRELEPELIERLTALEAMFSAMRSVSSDADGPESAEEVDRETWGHLEILAPLARGGFGVVYRAFDPILQREVALKLRRPDTAPAEGDEHAAAWIREARRLARVRHPNVLAVHGADVHDGVPGLWSDLVEGETLRDRAASGALLREILLSWARQLAAAVGAVHAAGIVHGDIKPSNVMVDAGDRVVLMDFGAGRESVPPDAPAEDIRPRPPESPPAKPERAESIRPGTSLVGSPLVMAPECLGGEPASFASDIYALGAVLHYAAAGRYPVEAERVSDLARALADGVDVDLSGTAAPRALQRLIARMLDADPERRPAIGEVADEIERIRQAPARLRRNAAVGAIVGLLVAGLAVSTIGYVRVRGADAETAAVNDFLREVLSAPRGSEGGRDVRVVELLERAMPEAERRYADQPNLLARIQELVGRTYVTLDEHVTAEPLLRAAHAAYADRFGTDDHRTVELLDPLARAEAETGETDAAERTWQHMLEVSDESQPEGRVNAITARIGLATLAMRQNRLDEAEGTLRDAIELGGPQGTDREMLRARMLLSDVLGRAGKLDEADAVAVAALEQSLALNGERHVNTLAARHNLVVSRYRTADFKSAEPLARENLEVALDWLGPLDRTTVTAQADLSNVLHGRGELEESLALLEAALQAAEQVFGRGSDVPTNLRVNLVARYLDMQRYEEAVALALVNADVLERFPAPSGSLPLVNGINLAEGYFRLDRYEESLEQARSMQRAVAETLGEAHPFARVAAGFAGASLSRLGRPEEAEAVLMEVLAALEQALGAAHPLTLDVAVFRAENLLELGQVTAALELAQSAQAGLLEVYPEAHFKVTGAATLLERIEARAGTVRPQ